MNRKEFECERREFLTKAGGLATLVLAHPFLPGLPGLPGMIPFARAQAKPSSDDHFFVCIEMTGGWDVTLGLDPQVLPEGADQTDMFLEYGPQGIEDVKGVRLGPSALPLKPFADECAVINGISMKTMSSHESHIVYMSSGVSGNSAASLPVEFAALRGAGTVGVIYNDRPYLMGMGKRTVSTSSSEDIVRGAASNTGTPLIDFGLESEPEEELSPLERAITSTVRGRESVASLGKRLQARRASGADLKPRHILADAFASGVTYHGRINTFTDPALDTHSGHANTHRDLQKKQWEEIASMFTLFKETPHGDSSLFNHTTFLVISEFARTAALVGTGKDHNPWTNSALLIGKGVRGGQVIGKSRLYLRDRKKGTPSAHKALPFDYVKQEVAAKKNESRMISPENVARTLLEIFKVPPELTQIGPTTPYLTSVVKK